MHRGFVVGTVWIGERNGLFFQLRRDAPAARRDFRSHCCFVDSGEWDVRVTVAAEFDSLRGQTTYLVPRQKCELRNRIAVRIVPGVVCPDTRRCNENRRWQSALDQQGGRDLAEVRKSVVER